MLRPSRRPRFSRLGPLVVLVALLVRAPLAHGEDAKTALARSLFRDGVGFVDHGAWPEAADRFSRALALRWSAPVAYNLALVWIELGRLFDAADLLHRVVHDPELSPSAQSAAEQKLGQVEARLGHLTVDVVGAREGVTVRMDGDPIPPQVWGVPFPADPGAHRLVAFRAERKVSEARVRIAEGGQARVRLSVVPSPEEVARAVVRDEARRRGVRQRRVIVASAVLSAVTTVTTMVLTAVILAKR